MFTEASEMRGTASVSQADKTGRGRKREREGGVSDKTEPGRQGQSRGQSRGSHSSI